MTEHTNRAGRVSGIFLLAGIAFFVFALVQLTGGGSNFAVFLAVAIGNFVAALIFRRKGNAEFLEKEREIRGTEGN